MRRWFLATSVHGHTLHRHFLTMPIQAETFRSNDPITGWQALNRGSDALCGSPNCERVDRGPTWT
jgi:hypothetical protein